MLKIAIIVGSTRPGRKARTVADWVHSLASQRTGAEYEIVDLVDFDLPHFDEALPPAMGQYALEHTKTWAAKIAEYDGFVFVTPEYNHGTSGALKNAIDFLGAEWANKAAGFVGYGVFGGARAVEQLRLVLSQLQVATVSAQVGLNLATDFVDWSEFKPGDYQLPAVDTMLGQVETWAGALAALRDAEVADEVAA